ncbi:hypothetical protein ACP70R_032217 [Stipagrostis hirtigluma subsp. patula]
MFLSPRSLARARPSLQATASTVSASWRPASTSADAPKKRPSWSRATAAAAAFPEFFRSLHRHLSSQHPAEVPPISGPWRDQLHCSPSAECIEEIDYAPELGETTPFKPFAHRYPTPYRASSSSEPYWYSVKLGPAHIIVLSSYSGFGKYTPQFKWLEAELQRVDRGETPWLFIATHAPWYNSNNFHYMEGEPMRVQFEKMAVDARVDVVFAGHVHAYERSHRFSNVRYNITDGKCTPVPDRRAPVYITIGDGGNVEGLADELTWPQPAYSAFRESSFGHAVLDIKNRTHAYYAWYRNHDGNKVAADTMWFTNRYHMPNHDDSLAAAGGGATAYA